MRNCTECESPVFARGLCQKHYNRMRRTGQMERRNVSNAGAPCSAGDCGRQAFAKGLCSKHYFRARHPLWSIWRNLRSRWPNQYPIEWETLDGFLEAIGERPTPAHQLRRPDHAKPWGPDNFEWREPINASFRDDAARYAWLWHIRKRYGLDEDQLAAMGTAQEDRCAICGTDFNEMVDGEPVKVCIDHNHDTGKVRGLLCDACNKGLGMFQDDVSKIEKAIAYLERHAQGAPT